MTNKPYVCKEGHDCWSVTHPCYCEELDETIHTVTMFRTWREAMQYLGEQQC